MLCERNLLKWNLLNKKNNNNLTLCNVCILIDCANFKYVNV